MKCICSEHVRSPWSESELKNTDGAAVPRPRGPLAGLSERRSELALNPCEICGEKSGTGKGFFLCRHSLEP